MRALRFAAVAVAGTTAAVIVRRRVRARGTGAGHPAAPRSGWLAVTVNRGVDEVAPDGRFPAALRAFGDDVELDVRPAPGDKGTELRARFRSGAHSRSDAVGQGGRGRLRAALREAKQLVEVGEVLRVDPTPHGRRTPTPMGWLVDQASDRSNEGGTL